jgi:hypothetical protein
VTTSSAEHLPVACDAPSALDADLEALGESEGIPVGVPVEHAPAIAAAMASDTNQNEDRRDTR